MALHSEPILEKLSIFLYDLYAYDERLVLQIKKYVEKNREFVFQRFNHRWISYRAKQEEAQ